MKLGEKVRFRQYFEKSKDFIEFEKMTPEQASELEEKELIVMDRWETVATSKELTGIIVGKRHMSKTRELRQKYTSDWDGGGELLDEFYSTPGNKEVLYLVACDLKKHYKVPPEFLEKVVEV